MKHTLMTTIAILLLVGCSQNEYEGDQARPGESPSHANQFAKPMSAPTSHTGPIVDSPAATNVVGALPISLSNNGETVGQSVGSPLEPSQKDLLLIDQFIREGYKNKKKIRPIKHKVGYDKKKKKTIFGILGTFVEFENRMTVVNNSRTKTTEAYIMPPEVLESRENASGQVSYQKLRGRIYDKNQKLVGYLIREIHNLADQPSEPDYRTRIGLFSSSSQPPMSGFTDNIMTTVDGTKTATLYIYDTISISGDFPWVEQEQQAP